VLRMPPVVIPAWQRPGLMAQVRRFAEPRLLMTAAMAFFSITLTLNLTGVRLTDLHWANLKPTAIRSIVERRLTTASTPIIRYYDHLRFVYEVESRMRELRRTSEGQSGEGRSGESKSKDTAPSGSGESKKTPAMKDDGSRMDPPQQSIGTGQGPTSKPEKGGARVQSSNSDFFEASLTFQEQPAHSGGSAMAVRERSTVWTA